ncbi:MAG: PqqD family protein [Clostridia bacterium]|nr:PqqD family protein [Clostridia bacterium]
MKIKKGFVLRKVGGESVVVPVGEMSKQFHGMINLNETGAFLWTFFSAEHTVDEGVAALLAEYDVDEQLARADVEQFVKTIVANGFAE